MIRLLYLAGVAYVAPVTVTETNGVEEILSQQIMEGDVA